MSRRVAAARLLTCVVMATVALSGCDAIYYRTMKKFGWEKRDILVKRVRAARSAQDEAQKEFNEDVVEVNRGLASAYHRAAQREPATPHPGEPGEQVAPWEVRWSNPLSKDRF